ncbi:MAG: hypothetical protein COA38_14480 [Fluviicola sp.]|nr:MAG: hypothetical protein COA38_14480 [Fluviicola sp.]
MKTSKLIIAGLALSFSVISNSSFAQAYNKCASQNVITESAEEVYYDPVSQSQQIRTVQREVSSDSYGNAEGNQYDLAVDGAFEGQTIAVLHLYTGEGFDFELPTNALKEKGFSVYRWINRPPSAEVLKEGLDKACQLWIVSSSTQMLNKDHLKVIKEFFDAGKGVYIWGDNQPYYADANYVAKALIGVEMTGNTMGNKVVDLMMGGKKVGVMPNHLITTGLQHLYEGVTIATLSDHKDLEPLVYGSAGNLVTAVYEKDGKRLILDGGFTRLYINWDTAGTGRYVKNAAAWLVNVEKFGDDVVSNAVLEESVIEEILEE